MLHAVSLEFEPTISDQTDLLALIERAAASVRQSGENVVSRVGGAGASETRR